MILTNTLTIHKYDSLCLSFYSLFNPRPISDSGTQFTHSECTEDTVSTFLISCVSRALRLLQLFQSSPRILFLHFYSASLRVTWCKVATIITNIIIFINVSVADNDFVVRFIHHEHIVRATTGTAANIKKREEINNDQTYCFSHNSLIGR